MNKYHALITSLFTCSLLADDVNVNTENVINKGLELEATQELSAGGIKSNELIRKQQYELEADGFYYKAVNLLQVGNYVEALQNFKNAELTYKKVSSSSIRILAKLDKLNQDTVNLFNSWSDELVINAESAESADKLRVAKEYLIKARELDQDNKRIYNDKIAVIQSKIDLHAYQDEVNELGIIQETEEMREDVPSKLDRAQLYYKNTEYINARNELEDILIIAPFNEEAAHLLFRTYQKLKETGEKRYQVTKADYSSEGAWKWNDQIHSSKADTLEELNSSVITNDVLQSSSLHEKLNKIFIPSVRYDGHTIEEIVEDLRRQSKEFDPDPSGSGVNIVLFKSEAKAAPAVEQGGNDGFGDDFSEDFGVAADDGFGDDGFGDEAIVNDVVASEDTKTNFQLSVDDIQLGELIKQITEILNMKFKVDGHAVYIADANYPLVETETVFFGVPLSMIDIVSQGGGGLAEDTSEVVNKAARDWQVYFTQLGVTFPAGSKISFVESVNRLVVTNTSQNIQLIQRIIDELGKPTAQISIETKFIDVDVNTTEELGFMYRWTGPQDGNHPYTGDKILAQDNGQSLTSENARFDNNIRGVRTVAGETSDPVQLAADLIFGHQELQMLIRALDQSDSSEVLSSPNAVTQSGNTVVLRVVQERSFPEDWEVAEIADDIITPAAPTFGEAIDLGVMLEVTPQADADQNTISMDITPQSVEFLGYDTSFDTKIVVPGETNILTGATTPDQLVDFRNTMPVIEVRGVETSVKIWDGETVLLGGLIREEVYSVEDSIPYLSDIPIVGRFFQNKGTRSHKTNLLVFVTGRLISPIGLPYRSMNIKGLPDFQQF